MAFLLAQKTKPCIIEGTCEDSLTETKRGNVHSEAKLRTNYIPKRYTNEIYYGTKIAYDSAL